VDDVLYWLKNKPSFGRQAVMLVSESVPGTDTASRLNALASAGVRIVAPPLNMLLTINSSNQIIPSNDAIAVQQAGLDIMTWTLERSGRIREDVMQSGNNHYYQTILPALNNDGDILKVLDVLAKDVGVKGVFSDWPATTTFYANCTRL
jgi:glycerophosphoryl diester phosphodiesterase